MLDRDWLPNGQALERILGKGESLQASGLQLQRYLGVKNVMFFVLGGSFPNGFWVGLGLVSIVVVVVF